MEKVQKPKKTISDLVRKLLKSNDISAKTAALYLDCTEQSFRNKLSRDSFSLKDLIILCYLCNARFMIEYCSYKDDYDVDFFNPSDYLSKKDYERIQKIEQQNFTNNFNKMIIELSKIMPKEELENMSSKELFNLMLELSKNELEIKKAEYNDKQTKDTE